MTRDAQIVLKQMYKIFDNYMKKGASRRTAKLIGKPSDYITHEKLEDVLDELYDLGYITGTIVERMENDYKPEYVSVRLRERAIELIECFLGTRSERQWLREATITTDDESSLKFSTTCIDDDLSGRRV